MHLMQSTPDVAANSSNTESIDLKTIEDTRTVKIKWLYGYDDFDGKSETHPISWFCADNGFDVRDLERINALNIKESMEISGPCDRVKITRKS